MFKILLSFILLAVIIGLAISTVRKMSGKEKWALTKTIGYATICSLSAMAVMISIVLIF
jgi:hypothetical protein